MASIAVIGAGLAGLVAARELSVSHQVQVFEKSRGVGGRMATRRAGPYQFDHGAQFFTARTPEFREFLHPLLENRHVTAWTGDFVVMERSKIVATQRWDSETPHYVGVPGMTAPCKWLAGQLDVTLQVRVASLEQQNGQWLLIDDSGTALGIFDWVVLTVPAPQATALLPEESSILRYSESARMLSCYSLMLGDERPLNMPWQAAIVHDADIGWISIDSKKPGRGGAFCVMLHSTSDWADAHIDDDPESVSSHLLAESSDLLGVDTRSAAYRRLHRWRYANIDVRDTPGYAIDTQMRLAACGDWFIRGRVEAAFTSALRVSTALQHVI